MRPLVGYCYLGLGRLYRRPRRGAKGEEHLISAVTLYREMDMGLRLAPAEPAMT